MPTEEPWQHEERHHHRHRGFMLIPAGGLLGLGIGLIGGHPAAGVLIGLGLGFVGAALYPPAKRDPEATSAGAGLHRRSVILALVGLLLAVVGTGTLWLPFTNWPVIAALFIILLGLWFLFRALFPEK